jgi:hypothetical protein
MPDHRHTITIRRIGEVRQILCLTIYAFHCGVRAYTEMIMTRREGLRPEPEETAKVLALAKGLSRHLERELECFDGSSFSVGGFKTVYDMLYLPAARALADALDLFLDTESDLLRQPCYEELEGTHVRVVIEVIHDAAKTLCEQQRFQ